MKKFFALLVGLSLSVFLFTNNASFALEESNNWDANCATMLDGAGSSIDPVGANSYCYGRAINGGSRTTTNTSAQNLNPDSYLIKNNLKMGSRDSSTNGDVTRLQAFLIQKGHLSSAPTGYFGRDTRKAVIQYQKSAGLTAQGFVGGLTRNMISSESRSGNSISPSSLNTYNLNVGETNPSSGSIACRYATPPEGCFFVKGKEYNSTNNCGMVLSCKSESEAQFKCDYTAPREGCELVPGPNYNSTTGCGRIPVCNTKPTDPTDTTGATGTATYSINMNTKKNNLGTVSKILQKVVLADFNFINKDVLYDFHPSNVPFSITSTKDISITNLDFCRVRDGSCLRAQYTLGHKDPDGRNGGLWIANFYNPAFNGTNGNFGMASPDGIDSIRPKSTERYTLIGDITLNDTKSFNIITKLANLEQGDMFYCGVGPFCKIIPPASIFVDHTPYIVYGNDNIITPSITIISPNGGEYYRVGENITVKWSTKNIPSTDKIKLRLIYNGGVGGSAGDVWLSNLAGSQSFLNDGSEIVQIPKNLPWASVNEWFSGNYYTISAETENSTLRDVSDNLFTIDAGRMSPIDYNSPCTGNTITVKEQGLINLGGTAIFSKLGMDISSHPEILKYRIQWFNGTWSPWYVPGVEDQDWKNNYDGSARRIWSYFDDHTHEYVKCVSATSNSNDKILISFDLNGGSGAIKSPLSGPTVSIPASYIPTRNGFTFVGWEEIKKDYSGNFISQTYQPGNTYSFKRSMTLIAIWKKAAEQETAICSYPAPQEGCTYLPGKAFNPINNCGMVLSCKDTEETIERTDLFMRPLDGQYKLEPRVYGVGSYQFARSLTKGMHGEDVKMLQKFLNTQGYKVELSGYYGEKTKEALTNFQNAHKAEILDKAGIEQGTGDFYFLTLSFVNELLLNSSSINLNN